MSYTLEDFKRDYLKEHVKELTAEELVRALPTDKLENVLGVLASDEVWQNLPKSAREAFLKTLQRKSSSPT